jgi:prepilin-type N-terminal cleavage/methylation domain-containing protein
MKKLYQRGFSSVEMVVVIVIVAALVAVGYVVYQRAHKDDSKTPTAAEQTTSSNTPSSPAVDKTSDLDSASKALDDTNLDAGASDNNTIDKDLNSF